MTFTEIAGLIALYIFLNATIGTLLRDAFRESKTYDRLGELIVRLFVAPPKPPARQPIGFNLKK